MRLWFRMGWDMKYNKTVFKIIGLISQLSVSIVVPIFMCTFLGVFLEEKFSISITVLLIILGVLAGGRNAYILLKQAVETMKEDKYED